MAGYIFNSNQIPMLHVPKSIVTRFLPIATGSQIKVILCLIGFEDMAGQEIIKEVADGKSTVKSERSSAARASNEGER